MTYARNPTQENKRTNEKLRFEAGIQPSLGIYREQCDRVNFPVSGEGREGVVLIRSNFLPVYCRHLHNDHPAKSG